MIMLNDSEVGYLQYASYSRKAKHAIGEVDLFPTRV